MTTGAGALIELAHAVDTVSAIVKRPPAVQKNVTAFRVPLIAKPQIMTTPIGAALKCIVTVHWCAPAKCWVLDMADANGVPLLSGVPLITGADLLAQYGYQEWGVSLIVQTTNDADAVPNEFTLGTTGNLYVVKT